MLSWRGLPCCRKILRWGGRAVQAKMPQKVEANIGRCEEGSYSSDNHLATNNSGWCEAWSWNCCRWGCKIWLWPSQHCSWYEWGGMEGIWKMQLGEWHRRLVEWWARQWCRWEFRKRERAGANCRDWACRRQKRNCVGWGCNPYCFSGEKRFSWICEPKFQDHVTKPDRWHWWFKQYAW